MKVLVPFSELFRIKETVLCFEVATDKASWINAGFCFVVLPSLRRKGQRSVSQISGSVIHM